MLDDYENEDVISYVDELVKDVTSKTPKEKMKELYMSGTKKLLMALTNDNYSGDFYDLVSHYATFLKKWHHNDSEFADNYKCLVESLPISSIRLANTRLFFHFEDSLFEYAHKYASDIFEIEKSQDNVKDKRTKVSGETVKSINRQAVILLLNSLLDKNSQEPKKPIEDIIDDFYLIRCTWQAHDPNFAFLYKELLAEYSNEDFELLDKIFKENGNVVTLDIDDRKEINEKELDEKIMPRSEFQKKLNSMAQGQRNAFVIQTLNTLVSQILKNNSSSSQEELIIDFVHIRHLISNSTYQIWLDQILADDYNNLKKILEQHNISLADEFQTLKTLASQILKEDSSRLQKDIVNDFIYIRSLISGPIYQKWLDQMSDYEYNHLKEILEHNDFSIDKGPSSKSTSLSSKVTSNNLSYQQFLDLIPEETLNYLKFVAPYLATYLKKSSLSIENVTVYGELDMYFVILFATSASFLPSYLTQFKQAKFHIPEIERPKEETDLFEIENILRTFAGKAFQNPLFCSTLLPIDLLDLVFDKFYDNGHFISSGLLFNELSSGFVNDNIGELSDKEHEQYLNVLERKLFEGYPLVVNKYINNAVVIQNALRYQECFPSHLDIPATSLLLSIYFSRHVQESGNKEITDIAAIWDVLEENGFDIKDLLKGFGLTEKKIQDALLTVNYLTSDDKKGMYAKGKVLPLIRSQYYPYYASSNPKEVQVSTIFQKLLDPTFVGNMTVDSILGTFSCSSHLFDDMDELLVKTKEKLKREQFVRDKHDFYNSLSRDVRSFIDYTGDTYQTIITRMQDEKHNTRYLSHEEDALGLAFLLSSYHFGNDVSVFFNDHGVTKEKVLDLVKLNVTDEDIANTTIPFYTLGNTFRAIIYEGNNKDLNSREITLNDIVSNFIITKSVSFEFIKTVFETIQPDIGIEQDFIKQVETYLANKKEKELLAFEKDFFEGLSPVVSEFLKLSISSYGRTSKPYDSSLIAPSFIDALVKMKDNEKVGPVYRYCTKYFPIDESKLYKTSRKIDYDKSLLKEYLPFLQEGVNATRQKNEITIPSIIETVFSLNYRPLREEFVNLDEKVANFIEEEKREEEKRKQEEKNREELSLAEDVMECLDEENIQYMKKVLLINRYIKEHHPKKDILKDSSIRQMSLALALYYVDNPVVKYFEKQYITLGKLANIFEVDTLKLKMLQSEDIDYRLFFDQYLPYFMDEDKIRNVLNEVEDLTIDSEKATIAGSAKFLFQEETEKDSTFQNAVKTLGCDYDILKYEVTTLQDYELSLDLDARIGRLLNTPISSIDLGSMKDILFFGDSIYNHLRYIQDALPTPSEMATSTALQPMSEVRDKIYLIEKVEKKRTGILKMIPQSIVNLIFKPQEQKVLDPASLPYLRETLDKDIEVLSEQVKGYDAIRQYIEAHKAKNEEMLQVAKGAFKQARKKEIETSRDKAKFDEYLTWKAKRETLEVKVRRLKEASTLLKQQLTQINQMMASHVMTIDGLKTSRDNFIPIIGSQIAIQAGLNAQGQSLELTQGVMNLMDSLIQHNKENATENVQLLHSFNLPSDTYDRMESAVNTFFARIEDLKKPSPLDSLPPIIDAEFTELDEVDKEIKEETGLTPGVPSSSETIIESNEEQETTDQDEKPKTYQKK